VVTREVKSGGREKVVRLTLAHRLDTVNTEN